LQKVLDKRLSVSSETTDKNFFSDYFSQIISEWKQGQPTDDAQWYSGLLYQKKTTIADYFPQNSLLIVDDFARIMETNREFEEEEGEWQTQKIAELRVFSEQSFGKDIQKTLDRKSTRLNSSHVSISYAVFCLKKKKNRE